MHALLLTLLPLCSGQEPATATRTESQATAQPQIEWQRSLADALAMQQRTGRPLLICVNQDGEVFCERFAAETYRDPEFIALTRGYVCVVASPDRHSETDYDGLGRRVECPRFLGCTCSEHAQIEPELFARWFQGRRTAPRHIGVDKDGNVLFDRFLDDSMQSAIDAVRAHAGTADSAAVPADSKALLARRDAGARMELEARYRLLDRAGRLALLAGAAAATNEPFDLLRMGLRDDDAGVFAAAAQALAATATGSAWIDVADALARCDDAGLAGRLQAAVERLGADAPKARQFAAHLRAAQQGIERAGREPFAAASEATPAAAPAAEGREVLEDRLDAAERASRQAPDDPAAQLELALANLALADLLGSARDPLAPMLYEDARRAADRGRRALTGTDHPLAPSILGVIAIASWQQGDAGAARTQAGAALAAAEALGARADSRTPLCARWLGTAARAAAAAAYAAVAADADAVAAADVEQAALCFWALAHHPHATEQDQREAAALLAFAGARRAAQQLLAAAIANRPDARELHQDYRLRLVADRSAEALRAGYAAFVERTADRATAEWFAGYAAIVAAELHVKDRRSELAEAAYSECIERHRRSGELNAAYADSANHFVVLALAGRALLRHLRGDGAGAVADLLAAGSLRPASMAETDGLGRRPEAIQRRIQRELRDRGQVELADKLPAGQ